MRSCLKTPYLIYVADSLALNSWPTALQLMPEGSWSNTRTFSLGYILTVSCLETQDSISALYLGAILNSKIAKTKNKTSKNVAPSRPQKSLRPQKHILVYSMSWNKKAECVTLFSVSRGCTYWVMQILHHSAHAIITVKGPRALFWDLQTNVSEWVNSYIRTPQTTRVFNTILFFLGSALFSLWVLFVFPIIIFKRTGSVQV